MDLAAARALLLRVVVVLDPDPAEQRVEMVRHVTGRVDIGRAGPAELVDQDPVVLRDAPTNAGTTGSIPMPATTKSQAMRSPAAVTTASTRSAPFEGGDLVSGPQLDAVRAVDRADQRAPTSPPSTRSSGARPGKTAVTWTPSWVSEAATSQPMNPMPTTTARRPGRASCLIASHSATVRR